jgi:SAM-dependent methyltransferase
MLTLEPRNSTRSLYDSDVVYVMIHGRRYCRDYYMPNDEEEQDRGQMLHDVYLHIFDNRLTTVPLRDPGKILDIGTGTGEWAMAMAEEFPNTEVIGTDIAQIQPAAGPPNVFFEIDDAEEEYGWTWPEDEFDLVHLRSMAGAFTDWQYIYREAIRHLKPGGWLEVIDFDNHSGLLSYFSEGSDVKRWLTAVNEASKQSGRPRGEAHLNPELLTQIGFEDVSVSGKMIPTGAWPEDEEKQKVGKHFLVTQLCGVEALCLRPLTEQLGWKIEDIRKIVDSVTESVRSVAMDPEKSKGMGFNVKVLVGRKPGSADVGPPEVDVPDEESIKTMTNANGGSGQRK